MQRKVYILEGLDCANCAAKIENKLSKIPELSDVAVTYATKQLRFSAEDPDAMIPKIKEVIRSVEPDVVLEERNRRQSRTTAGQIAEHDHGHNHNHDYDHAHDHGDCCGHDHDHDHNHHHHDHGATCDTGHHH